MRGPSYHCKEFATLSPGTRHSCTLPWRIRQVEANYTKRKSDYFPFYTLWHPRSLAISAHWSNQALPSYSAVTHKEPGLWKSFCISVQFNFPTLQVTIMERMVELGCDPLAANRWLWRQKKKFSFPYFFCALPSIFAISQHQMCWETLFPYYSSLKIEYFREQYSALHLASMYSREDTIRVRFSICARSPQTRNLSQKSQVTLV